MLIDLCANNATERYKVERHKKQKIVIKTNTGVLTIFQGLNTEVLNIYLNNNNSHLIVSDGNIRISLNFQ